MNEKKLQFTYWLEEKPEGKFKRIVWLGLRYKLPGLGSKLHTNSEVSLQTDILRTNIYPVMLVWENELGSKNYATVKAH